LGLLLIHEMNRLGFVIDLSHCGYRTSYEAIGASSKPVIFSHANALSLCKSPRNKPDILIRAIAEKGGVAGAVCWAPLLKQATRPSLEDYLDQLDYMINLAGIEHVSFASDLSEDYYLSEGEWDMAFGPHGMYPVLTGGLGDWYTFEQQFPEGCESLEKAAHIWEGLVLRGYSEDDAEKIMCKNLQRVFREVWGN
jgi:membrane dipeptidase